MRGDSVKRLLLVLLMASAVVATVFGLNLLVFVMTSVTHHAPPIRIDRGASFSEVVVRLQEGKIISNGTFFKVYVVLRRSVGKIRAGDYQFSSPITPREVLKELLGGDFARFRVTVVEGWTLKEIAHSLVPYVREEDFLRKATDPDFIRSLGLSVSSLEGYLFPDTYEIYRPEGPDGLLRRFVRQFQEVWKEFEGRAAELGLTEGQVVTLASIVEKETARPDEAPLIASVFFNRLKLGMPLATDPAVIYGLENFSGNLTKSDLERPGPYNTYLNVGLPPTPISNPGRAALRAVLFAPPTDSLYFVSRGDGTHEFSRTALEHQQAVYKYQILHQVPNGTSETAPSSRPFFPGGR